MSILEMTKDPNATLDAAEAVEKHVIDLDNVAKLAICGEARADEV